MELDLQPLVGWLVIALVLDVGLDLLWLPKCFGLYLLTGHNFQQRTRHREDNHVWILAYLLFVAETPVTLG